jgi:hypothetical protein
VVNVALHKSAINHPYVISYLHVALWSINERLGGREGLNLPEPSLEYIDDIVSIVDQEHKERKRIQQEL